MMSTESRQAQLQLCKEARRAGTIPQALLVIDNGLQNLQVDPNDAAQVLPELNALRTMYATSATSQK